MYYGLLFGTQNEPDDGCILVSSCNCLKLLMIYTQHLTLSELSCSEITYTFDSEELKQNDKQSNLQTYFYFTIDFFSQELRQMEQIETAAENGRRNTIFAQESLLPEHVHLKTELALMQRKYERLLQKERRMIVSVLHLFLFV